MNQKPYLILDDEFIKYCELNDIKNPIEYSKIVFKRGFMIEKYGESPTGFPQQQEVIREVIKEVIVEVIREVPVEVKGETQVITKEIIKEVPVDRIVNVTNTEELNEIRGENIRLKEELETIKLSLESFGRKGKYMKDSKLDSLYGE